MKVSRDGSRVVLIETMGVRPLTRRVTVRDPGGALVAELGRDESGRLQGVPGGLQMASDGFWVWYPETLALFSADGVLLDTLVRPTLGEATLRGVSVDRSFLVLSRSPAPAVMLGWTGGQPVSETQAFHVTESGNDWRWTPIAVVSWSNYLLGVRTDDGRPGPTPFGFFQRQPFSDNDLVYVNQSAGNLGIVKRNGDPGELGINEIGPLGDTVWSVELSLPPVAQSSAAVESAIDNLVGEILGRGTAGREPTPADRAAARRKAVDALHLPAYRPPAYRATFTASDELWLLSAERVDTLAVWYAVPHGDGESIRRVLLPEWFILLDATGTHVWGHRNDLPGGVRVLGRALVSPSR